MELFLTIVHISVCLFLIIIVLLQHGKGADMGATFGGASQTVFGATGGATIMSKITVGAVVTFMLTSLSLAYLSSRSTKDTIFTEPGKPKTEAAEGVAPTTQPAEKAAEKTESAPAPAPADTAK